MTGRRPITIRGMWGLGDNIFSRPFVRAAAAKYDVYLETPWPELYADLDIRFVRGRRQLRTQQKNMARQGGNAMVVARIAAAQFKVGYSNLELHSIIRSLERRWSVLGVEVRSGAVRSARYGPVAGRLVPTDCGCSACDGANRMAQRGAQPAAGIRQCAGRRVDGQRITSSRSPISRKGRNGSSARCRQRIAISCSASCQCANCSPSCGMPTSSLAASAGSCRRGLALKVKTFVVLAVMADITRPRKSPIRGLT